MLDIASLCILAYKRPIQLQRCMQSIFQSTRYPHEIIVNLDGDDSGNSEYLFDLYKKKRISKLIMHSGENRGVGVSFQNCISISDGKYIVKIDTDLEFSDGWLSTMIRILDGNLTIGAVSPFNYRHYDSNDNRFNILEDKGEYSLVDDFVSSCFICRKEDITFTVDDDGIHTKLKEKRGQLAITSKDYCINTGFGVGKSVYVSGTEEHPFKTKVFDLPRIFH